MARELSRGLILLVVKCYFSPVLLDNFFLVMGKEQRRRHSVHSFFQ
jgi:hypothetical protein